MTGYESKRAAAQDKLVVTDLDGHVVRGVRKQKKVAALDRDAEIERLNEKIEFLARTNMLYSDWVNAELRAEIERLKKALAQPAQEPVGYAVPTFDFDNSVIKKVHYSRTVPLYTAPPQRPWVGLTEQEFQLIYDMGRTPSGMMEMVESMLKDKNT